MDPNTGKLVSGQWPLAFRSTVRATKSKNRTKKRVNQKIRQFTVRHNAPTKDNLSAIAKGIFEYYSQQQIGVKISTMDMSIAMSPEPADIRRRITSEARKYVPSTSIRNGTTIRLRIDRGARHVLEKALTVSQKRRELRARGYQDQVAQVLARGFRKVDQSLFVAEAVHNIDNSGFYSLDINAMNFITVTAQ